MSDCERRSEPSEPRTFYDLSEASITHSITDMGESDNPLIWRPGKFLGAGAFGRVIIGVNTMTGELMAVKQISLDKTDLDKTARSLRAVESEIAMLRKLCHPHIVSYIATERVGTRSLNIFMEYVSGGSLVQLLRQVGGRLDENVVRLYACQILQGLQYLHRMGIAHRDIKGANVLVSFSPSVVLKLSDFGASKSLSEIVSEGSDCKSLVGTPYWMAPEVVRQSGVSLLSDVWSVGCTVIEMVTGKPPWHQFAPLTALFKIGSPNSPGPDLPPFLSSLGREFLQACFAKEAEDRPSADALLGHPWIRTPAPIAVGPLLDASATGDGVSSSGGLEGGAKLGVSVAGPDQLHVSDVPANEPDDMSTSSGDAPSFHDDESALK